jgi:hypothetical protein
MNTATFYNTIHEDQAQLRESIRKAKTQEDKVEVFFKANPEKSFTPFDIQYLGIFDDNVPITSIRRAITNLEKRGVLKKTMEQREGGYGKVNYCWKLYVPKEPKQYVQVKLF